MMPLKKRHREVPLPSPPGASNTPPSVEVNLSLDRTKPIDLTTTPPAATAATVLDDYADEGPSDGPADDGGAKRQQQQHLSDDPSRPEAYEVRYPHVPPEELLCDSETGKWIVTSMTRDRKRKVGTIEVCMDASGTGRAWFCDAATHQHIKYRLVPDPARLRLEHIARLAREGDVALVRARVGTVGGARRARGVERARARKAQRIHRALVDEFRGHGRERARGVVRFERHRSLGPRARSPSLSIDARAS